MMATEDWASRKPVVPDQSPPFSTVDERPKTELSTKLQPRERLLLYSETWRAAEVALWLPALKVAGVSRRPRSGGREWIELLPSCLRSFVKEGPDLAWSQTLAGSRPGNVGRLPAPAAFHPLAENAFRVPFAGPGLSCPIAHEECSGRGAALEQGRPEEPCR